MGNFTRGFTAHEPLPAPWKCLWRTTWSQDNDFTSQGMLFKNPSVPSWTTLWSVVSSTNCGGAHDGTLRQGNAQQGKSFLSRALSRLVERSMSHETLHEGLLCLKKLRKDEQFRKMPRATPQLVKVSLKRHVGNKLSKTNF